MKINYLFLLYYLRINKNQASKVFLNIIPFYYILYLYIFCFWERNSYGT